jgi:hypothetical protein
MVIDESPSIDSIDVIAILTLSLESTYSAARSNSLIYINTNRLRYIDT